MVIKFGQLLSTISYLLPILAQLQKTYQEPLFAVHPRKIAMSKRFSLFPKYLTDLPSYNNQRHLMLSKLSQLGSGVSSGAVNSRNGFGNFNLKKVQLNKNGEKQQKDNSENIKPMFTDDAKLNYHMPSSVETVIVKGDKLKNNSINNISMTARSNIETTHDNAELQSQLLSQSKNKKNQMKRPQNKTQNIFADTSLFEQQKILAESLLKLKQHEKILEAQNAMLQAIDEPETDTKLISNLLLDDSNTDSVEITEPKTESDLPHLHTDKVPNFISRPCYFSPVQCLLNISEKKIFNIVELSQLANGIGGGVPVTRTDKVLNNDKEKLNLKELNERHARQQRHLFADMALLYDNTLASITENTRKWRNPLMNKFMEAQFAAYHQLKDASFKNYQQTHQQPLQAAGSLKDWRTMSADSDFEKNQFDNDESHHTTSSLPITNLKTRFGNSRWRILLPRA